MFQKPKRKVDRKLLVQVRKSDCSVCGKKGPNDASHIKSRGSGGPDEPWNIVSHCRLCHIKWGRLGWKKFIEKHPAFGMKLIGMGWVLDEELLGLWHPNLERGVE